MPRPRDNSWLILRLLAVLGADGTEAAQRVPMHIEKPCRMQRVVTRYP